MEAVADIAALKTSVAAEQPPWWTEADQAELAALTWELVDGIVTHREQCARCAEGYPPCPHVAKAIGIVVDWRKRRGLISYAIWIRRQRELLEYGRDVFLFDRGDA